MENLKLAPLTKEAFSPFGDVIETEGAASFPINNGTTTRFHDLASIQLKGKNSRSLISIARCQHFTLPIEINMMERHPLGSQAFIPLNNNTYMVAIAEDDNGKPGRPLAFLANGNQGINFHANVWHFPLATLQESSDFLIIDRGGDGDNLEEYFYKRSYLVS